MPVPNHRLKAAREAAASRRVPGGGMSRDELAEHVMRWLFEHDDRRRDFAIDRNHIGKIERGEVKRPAPHYRAALRAVLDATDEELGFGTVLAPDSTQRVAAAVNEPRRVDGATVGALAGALASVRRLEDETSAADVLPVVVGHRDLVCRLAAGARGGVRPSVIALLSELQQYLGWLSIPLQRWQDSRAHLDRAAALAMEAGDPLRLSTALSFGAYLSLRQDDPHTAEALSDAASRDERIDGGLRTYLTYQRAEIAARRCDGARAIEQLTRADRMVGRLPADDEPPASAYWYTPPFFAGQRAFVRSALGDRHAARQAARECVDTMPTEWSTSEWAVRRRALASA